MSLLIVSPGLSSQQALMDSQAIRAISEARRQGFSAEQTFEWAGGSATWFPTPDNPRGSGAFAKVGDRFAAYVGTVFWRGLTGQTLLRHLLATFAEPQHMPLDEFTGSFAMLFGGEAGVWLFTDPLGIHKVYETAERRLLSTSFMVCRATLKLPSVDRLRAQEYVLLGANHGRETPISGVGIMDPTQALELGAGRPMTLYPASRWLAPCAYDSKEEAVAGLAGHITQMFEQMVCAFGRDIGMALSGGFDSRLLLAALDKVGVRPTLYVYGAPNDDDVRVASVTADGLGIEIECIDKQADNKERPPLTLKSLQSNIAFFDGLPPDGAFDLGADRATRLKQVAGGRLNLNGGGGEILRNFFYLGDRDFSASEVVAAFYSNWPRQVFHSDEERYAFLKEMQRGVAESVGRSETCRLRRNEIELVYSLFRLRYWMGRNNSIAGRHGAFITPWAHPKLASLAASLPLAWKNYGRLEASIIHALSPRVAHSTSAYGFNFTSGPTLAHQMKVAATLFRPVALRRQSAQLRRALGLSATAAMPEKWRSIESDLRAQDWINADALTDEDQVNRLLTLQTVASDSSCGIHQFSLNTQAF